jgi:hypothetical protein
MSFETKIKELSDLYLEDAHKPNITGFVDHLFQVAADLGSVACELEGPNSLRFFQPSTPIHKVGIEPSLVTRQATLIVENATARTVLRMMCARLGVICKERIPNSVSPYGGQGKLTVGTIPGMVFRVAFTNTSSEQRFELTGVPRETVGVNEMDTNLETVLRRGEDREVR